MYNFLNEQTAMHWFTFFFVERKLQRFIMLMYTVKGLFLPVVEKKKIKKLKNKINIYLQGTIVSKIDADASLGAAITIRWTSTVGVHVHPTVRIHVKMFIRLMKQKWRFNYSKNQIQQHWHVKFGVQLWRLDD